MTPTGPAWRHAPAAKAYRSGTHRICTPAETLARVRPHLAACGITRVGMITGLDVIGLPVAAAYRPNSRTIAVHQGKGLDIDSAKASAVMEAIEAHHGETIALPLRLADRDEIARIGRAVDLDRLPRTNRQTTEGRLLWLEGTELLSGETLFLPHDIVGCDYTLADAGQGLVATTNGLASGNHMIEAVLHGLCEVVERDAVALWDARPRAAQERCAIDPATIRSQAAPGLLDRFAASGMAYRIWNITSDVALPVFACLLAAEGGTDGVQPQFGFGCHPDPDVALLRALTEAAQGRLTLISGAREDLRAAGYDEAAQPGYNRAAARRFAEPATANFAEAPNLAGGTLDEDLDAALAALARAGFGEIACADLTKPECGIPVARVVVPGLEGPWGPGHLPGPRASTLAA